MSIITREYAAKNFVTPDSQPKSSGQSAMNLTSQILGKIDSTDKQTTPSSGSSTSSVVVTSSPSPRGGNGGGSSGVTQKTDAQMTDALDYILDLVHSATLDKEKEKKDLKSRLDYHNNQMLLATLLAGAGKEQLASTIVQSSGQEITKIQYLLGQLTSDPEMYQKAKVLNVVAQLGPALQGIGYIGSSKYNPEAYAVQKYQAGAGYAQAAAYGRAGGGGDAGGLSIDYLLKLRDSLGEMADSVSRLYRGRDKQAQINRLLQFQAEIVGLATSLFGN